MIAPEFKILAQSLFLHSPGKAKWYHGITLLFVMAVIAWYSSPYFMYYVAGLPKLEELQIFEGRVVTDGRERIVGGSRLPPKFFVEGVSETKEIHCGFRSRPLGCDVLYYFWPSTVGNHKIWYHWYFGVMQVEYPSTSKNKLLHDRRYANAVDAAAYRIKRASEWWLFALAGLMWLYGALFMQCLRDHQSLSHK